MGITFSAHYSPSMRFTETVLDSYTSDVKGGSYQPPSLHPQSIVQALRATCSQPPPPHPHRPPPPPPTTVAPDAPPPAALTSVPFN